MAKSILQVESNITLEEFIQECIELAVPDKIIPQLTKRAFLELGIDLINATITKIKEQHENALTATFQLHKILPDKKKESGKVTIHSVIMDGLRSGNENCIIIANLKSTFPDVLEQKLKQRVYEYRNHFKKGKIK